MIAAVPPAAWIGGGVVVLLAVIAGLWALLRRRARLARIDSAEEVAAAAQAQLPGFATAGAIVGADGAAALAVDGRGRVAVVKREGKDLRAREIGWDAVRATVGGMMVDLPERRGERGAEPVLVSGVDALDIRRLAPQLTRGVTAMAAAGSPG